MNNTNIDKILSSDEWKKLKIFITPFKVARFLNLSTSTVLNLIKTKKIEAIIKNNCKRNTYRILKHSLENYIKRSEL